MLKSVHGLASAGSWLISFRRMKSIVGLHFPFRWPAPVFSFGCSLFFVWVQANE